jgi:DNA-binding Lrp family transcriptional regulator
MSNRDIIHHLRQVYGTELYEFLTDKVGALPGVERVETAPVIRTVKQASPVMVPVRN